MSLDSFSASLMLGAVKGGAKIDDVVDMHKKLFKEDGGPSDEAREFFEKNKGKKCKIKWTSHEAIIERLNEATSGFYPGGRFPIKVKITNGEAAGSVFEYDLDQVEVVEE